jgi:hypothetical protein
MKGLTLVFRIRYQLAHHSLNNTDVSIEKTAEHTTCESNGEILSEADEEKRHASA